LSDVAKSKRDSKGRFAAIPERALADKRLSASHFRVLGKVALHDGRSAANGGDGCWKSQQEMAEGINLDGANFSRTLKELLLWGYVRRERHPRDKRKWTYRVTYTGREILVSVANDLVVPGANDLSKVVVSRDKKSLYPSQKSGNDNNGLSPLLDPTRSLKEQNQEGEASPSPCNSRASASQKKEEEASKEKQVVEFPKPQPSEPSEGPTQEVRDRGVENWELIKRKMRGAR
jgi:DNA-binding MarR family transcriptional regulator